MRLVLASRRRALRPESDLRDRARVARSRCPTWSARRPPLRPLPKAADRGLGPIRSAIRRTVSLSDPGQKASQEQQRAAGG